MTLRRMFVANAVIAAGYGAALLLATDPILDIYGITPNPEGVYMARWFGVGLLAIGSTTWLARTPPSPPGAWRSPALSVSYGIGVVLALWGDARRALQRPGLDRGGAQPAPRAGFAYLQLDRPRTARAAGRP